jgi:hypothetical protein
MIFVLVARRGDVRYTRLVPRSKALGLPDRSSKGAAMFRALAVERMPPDGKRV